MASEYEDQANNLLKEMGVTFSAEFRRSGRMFDGDTDKDERDIYTCKLDRDGRPPLVIEFGQSLAKSLGYLRKSCRCRVYYKESTVHDRECIAYGVGYVRTSAMAPTAYDLLSCLAKSDPGTFEDFCGEYGCDTDSRKALELYLRVQTEWRKVRAFFTSEELEKVQEVQ